MQYHCCVTFPFVCVPPAVQLYKDSCCKKKRKKEEKHLFKQQKNVVFYGHVLFAVCKSHFRWGTESEIRMFVVYLW
jgi:hypothetical protein